MTLQGVFCSSTMNPGQKVRNTLACLCNIASKAARNNVINKVSFTIVHTIKTIINVVAVIALVAADIRWASTTVVTFFLGKLQELLKGDFKFIVSIPGISYINSIGSFSGRKPKSLLCLCLASFASAFPLITPAGLNMTIS